MDGQIDGLLGWTKHMMSGGYGNAIPYQTPSTCAPVSILSLLLGPFQLCPKCPNSLFLKAKIDASSMQLANYSLYSLVLSLLWNEKVSL